jgi:uncharacterized protein (DUF1778 family)
VSTLAKGNPSKYRRAASARVSLRIHSHVKALLVRAAKLQQVRLTEFMVRSSQAAAEAALAERTRFLLPPEKWREFNAALDSPPREVPRLRKLFSEPAVFKPA